MKQAFARKNKFNARKTKYAGYTFDSAMEARRYKELKLLEKAGAISRLELQVRYKLIVNGVHICDYVADFRYLEQQHCVTEDTKGKRTREYLIKKRLMLAIFGIEIRETTA